MDLSKNTATKTQLPLGFPVGGYPAIGMYYYRKNTRGRAVEEHANLCIDAGLNFEYKPRISGQWEFQLFAKGAKAGDEILAHIY